MNQAEIFLAGGGGKEESKKIDERLVDRLKLVGPNSLAYIPIAMNSRSYAECLAWFESIFANKVENIDMWDDLTSITLDYMRQFGAIYIGGGDTVRLMSHIMQSGFRDMLTAYVREGGAIYGGSAGAIVLGKSILTAPEVRAASLIETSGLNLLGEFSVYCHYKPSTQTKSEIHHLVRLTQSSILAIPEASGVISSGEHFEVVGQDECELFTGESSTVITSS